MCNQLISQFLFSIIFSEWCPLTPTKGGWGSLGRSQEKDGRTGQTGKRSNKNSSPIFRDQWLQLFTFRSCQLSDPRAPKQPQRRAVLLPGPFLGQSPHFELSQREESWGENKETIRDCSTFHVPCPDCYLVVCVFCVSPLAFANIQNSSPSISQLERKHAGPLTLVMPSTCRGKNIMDLSDVVSTCCTMNRKACERPTSWQSSSSSGDSRLDGPNKWMKNVASQTTICSTMQKSWKNQPQLHRNFCVSLHLTLLWRPWKASFCVACDGVQLRISEGTGAGACIAPVESRDYRALLPQNPPSSVLTVLICLLICSAMRRDRSVIRITLLTGDLTSKPTTWFNYVPEVIWSKICCYSLLSGFWKKKTNIHHDSIIYVNCRFAFSSRSSRSKLALSTSHCLGWGHHHLISVAPNVIDYRYIYIYCFSPFFLSKLSKSFQPVRRLVAGSMKAKRLWKEDT